MAKRAMHLHLCALLSVFLLRRSPRSACRTSAQALRRAGHLLFSERSRARPGAGPGTPASCTTSAAPCALAALEFLCPAKTDALPSALGRHLDGTPVYRVQKQSIAGQQQGPRMGKRSKRKWNKTDDPQPAWQGLRACRLISARWSTPANPHLACGHRTSWLELARALHAGAKAEAARL